jgi:hypothetical protein
MNISKKLNKLEAGLGFGLLAAEIVIGIPFSIAYLSYQSYNHLKKEAPQINQMVSTVRSNLPTIPNFQFFQSPFYNNSDSEDNEPNYPDFTDNPSS